MKQIFLSLNVLQKGEKLKIRHIRRMKSHCKKIYNVILSKLGYCDKTKEYFKMYNNNTFSCIPGCSCSDMDGNCSTISYFENTKNIKELKKCVIIQHDIYRHFGLVYNKLCQEILLYFKHTHPYMSRNIINLKFGFIISNGEEAAIKGACGCETHADNDEKCKYEECTYTLFINPLLVPLIPKERSFAFIFKIAKHEMVHLLLHTYDPLNFPLIDAKHDDIFVELMAQIDDHFYDRNSLIKKVW